MVMLKIVFCSMLIGPLVLCVIQSATLDLNVGAYFEFDTRNGGWNSAGVWPAVQLAVEHVNQRNDVLPGYRLMLHLKDSRVRKKIDYNLMFILRKDTDDNL